MATHKHTCLFNISIIYPFEAWWFDDGIYLTHLEDYPQLEGSRLLAINHIPIDTIAEKIATLSVSGNEMFTKWRLTDYINSPALLKGLHLVDTIMAITVTLSDSNGNIHNCVMGLSEGSIKHKWHPEWETAKNYSYQYDTLDKVLTLNYNSCFDDPKLPFKTFSKQLFSAIDELQPVKLIIDLRQNTGGYSTLLAPFINSLAKTYLNEKQGKIFVLVGRETFSAAVVNTVYLKNHTNAITIGENTAGDLNFYANVHWCELPATKLNVAYSAGKVETSKGKNGCYRPDIEIPLTISDFRQKRDAAVEFARKY